VTIYLGYGLQTVGLQTIDSSMSAFITAFYVPLVPLLQWIILRKAPRAMTLVGVALAFVGLILIAGPSASGISLGEGELLTILSTVAIAAEIVLISLFAGRVSLARVTVVQLLVASLLAFTTMPAVGEALPEFSWVWLVCGVSLGAASCLIQLTMNWAQRSVSPTRATVIYAAEPVWAGIIGRIAGERLGPLALLGAAFIVAGMLVSEITPRRQQRPTSDIAEVSTPSGRD
jgi:drug/metabolite transporter (DMT)-like permease